MRKFEGTQGPLCLSKSSHKTIMAGSFIDGHEGYLVASVHGNDNSGFYASEEEARNNAMLFAAAPDLLEQLQKIVADYESEIHDRYDGTHSLDEFLAVTKCAHAAINKALGGE